MIGELSENQKEYGHYLVTSYADKHKISYKKALEILDDTYGFKNVWRWVNCDTFLFEETRALLEGKE